MILYSILNQLILLNQILQLQSKILSIKRLKKKKYNNSKLYKVNKETFNKNT